VIQIRLMHGFEELEACVQLQIATWGYDAADIVPRKIFRVAQHIGGQVIGALDPAQAKNPAEPGTEALVGFAMAWPGVKSAQNGASAKPYLHSHMLAVLPGYRNQGLGARLKWWQRNEALHRGISHMEWTFDPVEIKNAHLNLVKLGAVVTHYEVDFYGSSSSPLQGGLPTDRLVARWEMDSARVQAASEGKLQDWIAQNANFPIEERILVPAEIYHWKSSEPDRRKALDVLMRNRESFLNAFHRGLAVVGYSTDAAGNGCFEFASREKLEESLKLKGGAQ